MCRLIRWNCRVCRLIRRREVCRLIRRREVCRLIRRARRWNWQMCRWIRWNWQICRYCWATCLQRWWRSRISWLDFENRRQRVRMLLCPWKNKRNRGISKWGESIDSSSWRNSEWVTSTWRRRPSRFTLIGSKLNKWGRRG